MTKKKPKNNATNENGWWVPVEEFHRQAVLPHKGSWQQIMLPDGSKHRALLLSTRPGWHDTNFARLPADPIMWLKPADKFRSAEDMRGK